MTNLLLTEGDLLQVENVSLKVATFARFQPQSVDFLDITNPKAVYPLKFFATAVYIYSEHTICVSCTFDNPVPENILKSKI